MDPLDLILCLSNGLAPPETIHKACWHRNGLFFLNWTEKLCYEFHLRLLSKGQALLCLSMSLVLYFMLVLARLPYLTSSCCKMLQHVSLRGPVRETTSPLLLPFFTGFSISPIADLLDPCNPPWSLRSTDQWPLAVPMIQL